MKQKLKRELRYWGAYYSIRMVFLALLMVGFVASGFYLFIASPPDSLDIAKDQDNRIVIVKESEARYLAQEYNSTNFTEEGFCIYGYSRKHSFYIKEIVKGDIKEQTNKSVNFNCMQPTIDRLGQLFKEPDYKILGTIHSHPPDNYRMLSYPDAISMGLRQPLYQLSGVHIDDRVNFYTTVSTNEDLPVWVQEENKEKRKGKNLFS